MKYETSASRRPGRPLSFDRDAALRRAMLAFWQHGYETTSIADLTAAMGITAPSLYTAFGDKKRLFLEAVRLYAGAPEDLQRRLDAAPTARTAAAELLVSSARAFTAPDTPRGCLLASATASGSRETEDVKAAVAEVRRATRDLLERRIEQDKAAGRLPASASPAALAAMVVALIQGMSVLARDGMGAAELLAMVEAAMQAWPREGGT